MRVCSHRSALRANGDRPGEPAVFRKFIKSHSICNRLCRVMKPIPSFSIVSQNGERQEKRKGLLPSKILLSFFLGELGSPSEGEKQESHKGKHPDGKQQWPHAVLLLLAQKGRLKGACGCSRPLVASAVRRLFSLRYADKAYGRRTTPRRRPHAAAFATELFCTPSHQTAIELWEPTARSYPFPLDHREMPDSILRTIGYTLKIP